MQFWQKKNLSTASREEDATQAGKRNTFSSQAKEFVPKILRRENSPKDDAETTQIDGIQQDKKSFPWRIKPQTKNVDVADEDDDDSTTLETVPSISNLDCASSVRTPSEHDDQQEEASDTPAEAESEVGPQDEKSSKAHECDKDETPALKVSANSWAAKRRADRNSRNAEELSDEEIVRKMKSILNKLTIEKFPVLSKQLASCGIKTSTHLTLLIQEIIEKAVSQHNFINMYADLCMVLDNHFAEHPISDDPGTTLKKMLLNACQCSFEKHLTAPANLKTLEGEELEVAELMYKMQMIGNIKFVGALIVRKMLASKVFFAIANGLLNAGIPEALETLAALLTVVGPSFDRPDCRHRDLVVGIFDRIEKISKDKKVKTRIRCLLRDLLELRAADWQDAKPKKLEGPSTLDDVAEKFYGEGHCDYYRYNSRTEWKHTDNHKRSERARGKPRRSEWEQAPRTELAGVVHQFQVFCHQNQSSASVSPYAPPGEFMKACVVQQEKCKEEGQRDESQQEEFDEDECNKKVAAAFIAFMKTRDIHQAATSIADLQVPDSLQSDQLRDLLRFIVEARMEMVRSLGFQLIVAICLEGCWSHASLVEGFQNFEGLCATNEVDAPDLANILCEEMVPAFTPLAVRGLLPKSQSLQDYQQAVKSTSVHTDDASNLRSSVVPSKNRRKKRSLIDMAAEQRQVEEKALQTVLAYQEEQNMQKANSWALGRVMAPSVYYCAPVMIQ